MLDTGVLAQWESRLATGGQPPTQAMCQIWPVAMAALGTGKEILFPVA